ncbi:hypothetical protein [Erwinia amylovora]|uniref:hypothetical protein n=1 Tax=Erwinia amylovora TaxID=552 RepID=UPI0020C11340|nr:hypothetical protein [Erwinia amylovora]MCK8417628.1 hypothetical protein [Erwinia amylovora]
MKYRSGLPEKKFMCFSIVNYSASAVLAVLFNSALIVGIVCVSAGAGVKLWATLVACVFFLLMLLRDRVVRLEIEKGMHDPVWGKHIMRQKQRERDTLNESHWITRPLFRLACFIGIHKKR